jgi:hypothetical protein
MAFNLNGVATDADLKFRNPFRSRTNTLLKSYIDSQLLLIRLKKLEEQGSTRDLNGDEKIELEQCVLMYKDLIRPGGVHKVSEKENNQLVDRVKSLLRDVQQKRWGDAFSEHDVANLDVIKAGTDIPEQAAGKLTLGDTWTLMKAAKTLAGPQNAPNAATDETLLEAAKIIARLQRAGEDGQLGGNFISNMVAKAMAAQGNLGAGVSAGVKQPAGKGTQWVRHFDEDGDPYYEHDVHESTYDLPAGDTWINGVNLIPSIVPRTTKARFQIINPYLVS